jgi:23S rRNA pseudouridine1911/1915/1917 synthase
MLSVHVAFLHARGPGNDESSQPMAGRFCAIAPDGIKHRRMTRLRASDASYRRPDGVEQDSIVSVFRVPPEVAGQRLDVFVQSQLRRTSRTRTQEIIRGSAFDAEGRPLRANDRVYAEQRILLWRAPWDEAEVPTDIPTLYEDDHLLAVDKPALLPVHPTARYHQNTVIKLLGQQRPTQFLSLAHRIDRETSGVLLLAKTPVCERKLKRMLELREGVEKTYVAMTWGVPKSGTTDGRFRFARSVELDPTSPYRVKMRVSNGPGSLHAVTWFEVLEERAAFGRSYARVQCELETGRQHQIRVHLAALGTPIVGDKLYGPDEACFARAADAALTKEDTLLLELPRHALHAASVALKHPITGEHLVIAAPLPDDLASFWNGLMAAAGA